MRTIKKDHNCGSRDGTFPPGMHRAAGLVWKFRRGGQRFFFRFGLIFLLEMTFLSVWTVSTVSTVSTARMANAREVLPVIRHPLTLTRRTVPYKTLLEAEIQEAVALEQAAIFRGGRQVWVKYPGQPPRPLSDLVRLPGGFDWFRRLCPTEHGVAIAVSRYSETQRKKDLAASRGSYVEGPIPAGMLVLSWVKGELRATMISRFKAENQPNPDILKQAAVSPETRKEYFTAHNPPIVIPDVQGCQWDQGRLLTSGYGQLTRLNLEKRSASLMLWDGEAPMNREALLVNGKALWFAEDHGGLVSGCLIRREGVTRREYCLLNLPNAEVAPNTILTHRGRLMTASLAGVVEIDEANGRYIHYPLHEDPKQMRVYSLQSVADTLWGIREDGWVAIHLPAREAVLYQLRSRTHSNNVFALLPFEGQWFVATDEALYQVEMP